jgi:hypothetical protein
MKFEKHKKNTVTGKILTIFQEILKILNPLTIEDREDFLEDLKTLKLKYYKRLNPSQYSQDTTSQEETHEYSDRN